MSEYSRGEILAPDEREQMLDRAARAVYAKRPFRTAASRSPWDAGGMEAMRFEFDDAPAYYQEDCREIAATALNAAFGMEPTPARVTKPDLETSHGK